MKKYVLLALLLLGYCLWFAPSASAADMLQVRPLLYKEKIETGQVKKGAIDLANGSDAAAEYELSVRLFRQVDNEGSLEFYDKPDVTDGIHLDVTSIELKSKDAARVTFSVDSTKLPAGDVFAVIFITTKHTKTPQAIVPAAQVGTLLVLQNGDPGPRTAQIEQLAVTQFQTGDTIKGQVTIKNPAPADAATGFFPHMQVRLEPWGASTQFDGPLVYAGRARTFDFSVPSSQFGLYKMTVTANDASASRYVFLVTGKWKIIAQLLAVVLICLIALAVISSKIIRRKRRMKKHAGSSTPHHR